MYNLEYVGLFYLRIFIMNAQQTKILKFLGISALFVALSGCDLLQKGLDQEDMNVYFYKPGGEELYLGVVRGIGLCRSTVLKKAQQFNFEGEGGTPTNPGENEQILADETNTGNPGWTYHCCWKTTTQTCKAKLK